jgi:hypothetical protein
MEFALISFEQDLDAQIVLSPQFIVVYCKSG